MVGIVIPPGFKLVQLTDAMQPAFTDLAADYASEPSERYAREYAPAQSDFPAFVKQLEHQAAGINLPRGYVPSACYWLQDAAGELLGSIRLRSLLTPLLAHEAGHIGYEIRPSRRGMGLGSIQLALMLPICRAYNLDHVMITCRDDNLASARVIEKNGGVLEAKVRSWIHPDRFFRRYWITVFELPMQAK